jgi:nucleoside-diphosphate kinase
MKHPRHERTLIIIKPDAIQRGLIGEIISRFERIGLKLVASKMVVPTAAHIEEHYTLDPEWRVKTGEKTLKAYKERGEKHPHGDDPVVITGIILEKLKKYMTGGPVIPVVLEGAHAVAIVRKLVGSTEPLASDVGSIRGDFVLDSYSMSNDDERSVRNLVHASGSVDEAEKEIAHWFAPNEIIKYRHIQDEILYGRELEGFLE